MAVQHPGDGVIRRVGGLEVIPEHPAVQRGVIRRVGGLEGAAYEARPHISLSAG